MSNQNLKYTLSLQDLFSGKMNAAITQTQKLDSAFSKLKGIIGTIGVGFGISEVVKTTAKFQSLENSIKATGDASNLKFLNEQIDRLGLDITAAYNGYKTFSGALMGTNLAGKEGNKVFRQVSEAATVMGLSGEQTEGAFLALGQMMSKGTVSAEELRGQLGERIPGAFQIAAKAMGVTASALGEMMKKGEVVAEDFLPKFGNELEKRFGSQAAKASESLQSNLNRLDAEWQRLKVTLGTTFLPIIIKIAKVFAAFLKILQAMMPVIKLGIILWTSYYIKLKLATIQSSTFALIQRAMAMGMTKSAIATGLLKRGIQGIGAAIKAVPIIGWIAAIIQIIIDLWNTSEGFRGFWYGLWEQVTVSIEVATLKLKGFYHQMIAMFTGDKQLMKIGVEESFRADVMNALAYGKGKKKGIESLRAENGVEGLNGEGGVGGTGSLGSGSIGSGTEISGARPQNLYINITKLVETMNIKASDVKESAGKMKQMVAEALLEAVNDVNYIAK